MPLTIYLDHSATAPVWPEVVAGLSDDLVLHGANPSSAHRLGRADDKYLDDNRRQIADMLGCQKNELLITSGGSESINLAIKGFLGANPRLPRRVVSSRGEHAATAETLAFLRQQGVECVELPLAPDGRVEMAALAAALAVPTGLISLIHVSNETGAVNDVQSIVRLRGDLQPQAAIHLDAVQTLGRQPFDFRSSGIDLMSGSGHKLGAPKGIGWLAVRTGIRLQPQIHGGGQQRGLRSGTENPPMVAALARAMRLTRADEAGDAERVGQLRHQLLQGLIDARVDFRLLSPADAVPQIVLVAFPGLRGETLLHALEAKEIYLSTGAACSSRQKKSNRVLQAMGIPEPLAACAVRISLSPHNTPQEIETTVQAISESCRWLVR